MHHQRACCAAAVLLPSRTGRARAGFDATAFLKAKLFFRPEELVTRLLRRLLRAAELLAHALFLGNAALALHASKQIALTARDRCGGFGTPLAIARRLGKRGARPRKE